MKKEQPEKQRTDNHSRPTFLTALTALRRRRCLLPLTRPPPRPLRTQQAVHRSAPQHPRHDTSPTSPANPSQDSPNHAGDTALTGRVLVLMVDFARLAEDEASVVVGSSAGWSRSCEGALEEWAADRVGAGEVRYEGYAHCRWWWLEEGGVVRELWEDV